MLVTDVIMPGAIGAHLAEQILELKPGLPVLFMSGYLGECEIRDRLIDLDLLLIPFESVDPAHRVRRVLDLQE